MQPRPSDIDHLKWLDLAGISSFHGKHVLDLGCGSGFLCLKAAREGAASATGIDIEIPEATASDIHSWRFLKQSLDATDWHKNLNTKADLILAFDIIEHLESPFAFLQSCRQALQAGGTLVVTTPNINSWERLARPGSWSGVRDPQHKTLFTRYSLQHLLKSCGFQVVSCTAPMRSLAFLGNAQPHIGGQIMCVAQATGL